MIVRELLTLVGYKVDKAAEQKASKSFEWLKGKAQELGLVLGAGAVVLGFKRMVDAASDAEETLNVVSTAFGDQADMVLDWAKTHAQAAGRSQYSLREYAAALGQVTAPTLQNAEATANLSTSLAALTVDMASFNNETEADTLGALRSGLIGSYEPLQRFGVVMNVATLETFANAKGIRKQMKDMSEAEKVMLRYRFIMERTTNQQGDAIKTAGGYANMTKRLGGVLKDLQINVGKLFLPMMIKLVEALVAATNAVGEFIYENEVPLRFAIDAVGNALQWVKVMVLGLAEAFRESGLVIQTILVGIGIRLLMLKAPIVLTFGLWAVAIAGIILLLDDLWKGFTTGEGVLAGWLNEFVAVANETDSYAAALGDSLSTALDFWVEFLTGTKGATKGTGQEIANSFQPFLDWWYDWIGLPGQWLGAINAEIDVFVKTAIATIADWANTVRGWLRAFVGWIDDIGQTAVDFWRAAFESVWSDIVAIFGGLGQDIMAIMTMVWDAVSAFIMARVAYWRSIFEGLATAIGAAFGAIGTTIQGAIDNIASWFSDKLAPIIDEIKTAVDFWQDKFGGVTKFVGEVATDIGEAIGAIGTPAAKPGGPLVAAAATAPPMMFGPPVIAPPPAAGRAGGDVNATQSIEVNVNAPGGDGPGIAAAVAPAVGRAAADSNRRTAQQLLLGGAS